MKLSKKPWEIVVRPDINAEVAKKIRRLVKPVLSTTGPRQGAKPCLFCGEETSWTISNKTVCPRCSAKYGFVNPTWLPDACKICSKQGEWVCGKDDQHSLCWRHRDAWYRWTREPFLPRGYDELPEDEKDVAWEKAFAEFIEAMKKRDGLI